MINYTPVGRLAQPFRCVVKTALLRCVDMAESASDAKAMILAMYESNMLSVAEAFAQIVARGLEDE